MDGILVPGGFGERGTEGKIQAIEFALNRRSPSSDLPRHADGSRRGCRATCAALRGFFQRVQAGCASPVIHLNGGSDRRGAEEVDHEAWRLSCSLRQGSLAQKAYGGTEISERHRHRYEFNNSSGGAGSKGDDRSPASTRKQIWWRSSNCPITPGFSVASFTRNSSRSRSIRTRSSRRSSARPRQAGGAKQSRVRRTGLRVQGSEFRAQSSELRVQSSEFRAQSSELRGVT